MDGNTTMMTVMTIAMAMAMTMMMMMMIVGGQPAAIATRIRGKAGQKTLTRNLAIPENMLGLIFTDVSQGSGSGLDSQALDFDTGVTCVPRYIQCTS